MGNTAMKTTITKTTLGAMQTLPLQPGDHVYVDPIENEKPLDLTIVSKLGDGSTAVAYSATSVQYGYPLVIKIPHNLRLGAALITEARWTPRPSSKYYCYEFIGLRSAHIPSAGIEVRIPVTVTKYYSGGDLTQYLQIAHKCPQPLAMRWIAQIATALREANVVHRDIKPDNIFLDEKQNAFIGDFGLAIPVSKSERERNGIQLRAWISGTPEYMSPEAMLQPEIVDQRSDIYAIGLVLFQLLTGVGARLDRPEDNCDLQKYIGEIQSVGFSLPLELVKGAKASLIIKNCTAVALRDRYQNYDDLLNAVIPLATFA